MNSIRLTFRFGLMICLLFGVAPASADVFSQCPPDDDGIDTDGDGIVDNDHVCIHVTASDGLVMMADGRLQYMFGYHDVSHLGPGNPAGDALAMAQGMMSANFPAPTIALKEGQKLYLSLTNVGMMLRPDLFDPHTIHYHGFPNASAIFDGVPGPSLSINMGSSITYFYNVVEVGTYAWHCHVEATEHMQMGMLGNLYVTPKQNNLPDLTDLSGFTHETGFKYAYNDGNGSTYYDVEFPIQLHSFDPEFHDASLNTQPLPFAYMYDTYPMLNGRGYPDTVDKNILWNTAAITELGLDPNLARPSQPIHSLIEAAVGDKLLLRLSSLSTVEAFTITTTLGVPMKVVGRDGRLLLGPTGTNIYYDATSINIAGGEMYDAIVDTAGLEAGTYFLYTTNLHQLSNNTEDYGGMMTEIVLSAPPPSPVRSREILTTPEHSIGTPRLGPSSRGRTSNRHRP
jgi:FtsP/CotA-like multicopper oxidase with cupredoxin domain